MRPYWIVFLSGIVIAFKIKQNIEKGGIFKKKVSVGIFLLAENDIIEEI